MKRTSWNTTTDSTDGTDPRDARPILLIDNSDLIVDRTAFIFHVSDFILVLPFPINLDEKGAAHITLKTIMRNALSKILTLEQMREERDRLKKEGISLVFTNGCFDILHPGHTSYLAFARNQGDSLVVGMNSDDSVRKIKGPSRPINSQEDRALVLAALECVDYVVIFKEDEPKDIIAQILPDILVKGEDWAHYVSGREVVEANGGKVVLAPLVPGKSTTDTIERMKDADQ